jgi:acetyl-CoA acetyltransferase
MPEAFIIDAVRTPVGRRGGGLATAHPADLGAHVITNLLARTHTDPLAVDDVVFGCVDTVGPQAGDIARTAWLAAGLPEAVPGVTVDRQCGSSQQAVHFAAQAVLGRDRRPGRRGRRAEHEHGPDRRSHELRGGSGGSSLPWGVRGDGSPRGEEPAEPQ